MPEGFRTLRANTDGSVDAVDAPYASTNDPFGAFFIIDADAIEEAEAIARLHPGTHLGRLLAGGIEIRPIEHYETL